MKLDYQEHHRGLLDAIEALQRTGLSDIEKIESSFKVSLEFWSRLKHHIKKQGFRSEADEIFFFRTVKPGFTSHIEYFTCRYHALLFKPGEEGEELARFWRWELRKIEKFHELNREFCTYIRVGHTERDQEYFCRREQVNTAWVTGRIHDVDPGTSTWGDHLVTMMKAYELYELYIRAEMKKLGGYFFLAK